MTLRSRRDKPRRKRPELFALPGAEVATAPAAARAARSWGLRRRRDGKRRSSRIENPGYLAWLRRQPCGMGPLRTSHPLGRLIGPCSGRVDPDHEREGVGKGQTASDHRAWSCCRGHHDERHGSRGRHGFWGALTLEQKREVICERIDDHWGRYQAAISLAGVPPP